MTIVSRTQFQSDTNTLYPDNTTGEISPADLRAQMDNIADSAVFRGIGFASAPTANDDDAGTGGNGEFNVGDVWVDETNNNAYICVDDTATSAVWEVIGGALVITSQSGTATSGQIATWASNSEIRGDAELTWDGSNILAIASASPILELQDTNGSSDNQRWLTWVDSSNFKIQAFTDAGVGGNDYLQLTRTGNVVDSLDFIAGGSLATSISGNSLEFTGAASTIQTTDAETLSLGTNGVDRLTFGANTYVSQFAGLAANLVGVQVGDSNLTTGNAEVHLGVGRTGDGISRIEFVTDTTYSTYGLRVERGAGENSISQILHRGTGNLLLQTVDAADLVIGTSNTTAITVDGSTQDVTIANDIIVGGTVDGRDLASDGTKLDTLNKHLPIESEASTTYVAVAVDTGKWKRMTSGSAVTVTINDAVFSAEDEVVFEQAGAGVITFSAGAGFDIRSRGGALATAGQYAVASLKFISSSEAILIGDIV
jgi:hypothetical protein